MEIDSFFRLSSLASFTSPRRQIIGQVSDPIFISQTPKGLSIGPRISWNLQIGLPLRLYWLAESLLQQINGELSSSRILWVHCLACTLPLEASFEELCLGEGSICGSLYISYKMFLELHAVAAPPFLAKRKTDLWVILTEPQKERILFFAQKSYLCSKYQESSYKIVTRWYRTHVSSDKAIP